MASDRRNARGTRVPDSSDAIELASCPLCVDLDGTVIRTDLLMECLVALFRQKPWLLFMVPVQLSRGRSFLKRWLAHSVTVDFDRLPYNVELLDWLKDVHEAGRRLILVTGSDEILARRIAGTLGIFDEVRASDGRVNLTGRRKAQALVDDFGAGRFDYVANSATDIEVWTHCRCAIVVDPSARTARRAAQIVPIERTFSSRKSRLPWLREIRIHQWLKNVLVFTPLVAGHQLLNPAAVTDAVLTFIAFSLCASGVYVLNDLLDLDADRRHPAKSRRPLACGDLSIASAALLLVVLLLAGLSVSLLLTFNARVLLLLYIGLTTLYSLAIKRKLLVDVFTLAGLYTLRIAAGGAATGIAVSEWMLSFSVFLFLSLAFSKRVAELRRMRERSEAVAERRAYFATDLEQLNMFGVSSGFVASLVLVLFINSPQVGSLYRQPAFLWLLCPVLLFWITRIWMLAARGQLSEDPVVFTLRDPASYWMGAIAGVVITAAYYGLPWR
jgi:4-hydroxybenzoate polyprenyltransferase/phosphoserine phosphatase